MATVHVGANADPHTEHHCGLLHLKVGLFRLNAVGHPRRPTCSLIARDDYAWRSLPSATERRYGRGNGVATYPRTCRHIDVGYRPEVPVKDVPYLPIGRKAAVALTR